ncbi:hypothetical protein [Microbacterium elymi]|uniref:GCVT N-terminal domain-containing protein n=1 Tax=Microbacterium elymi TaxID=2909587 RepID=A0ABY5NGR3_9MICO|nr:hypothetical protein [Microbacterium elymi]UUT34345.1 hypothetical protein L2X98_27275 [Microbacterium elymi]
MTNYTLESMRRTPAGYAWSRFGEPEYTTWFDENIAWKKTCYIGDWSFLWQHRITGPDALRLISEHTVNTVKGFRIGQSKHAIHTNSDGKIIHEGVLTKFGEDDYLVHGRGGFWLRFNAERGGYNATVAQENWFILQVSGPLSIKLLHKLDPRDGLLETGYMHVSPIRIAGHDIWALRQGMSGELGFELQGPIELKDDVYAALWDAGQEFGIRRMGGRGAPINHLEAGYPTIATEYIPAIFDNPDYLEYFMSSMPKFALPAYIAGSFGGDSIEDYYRTPVELGWARMISGDHEFPGREALLAEKENPRRVLRSLEWNSDDVADILSSFVLDENHYTYMELPRDQRGFMWADRVERDGRVLGVSTSRGFSYWFRKTLSLATIDVDAAEPGSQLEVVWGNPGDPEKRVPVTVHPSPYKAPHAKDSLLDAVQ